jgi:hypothetical protein
LFLSAMKEHHLLLQIFPKQTINTFIVFFLQR